MRSIALFALGIGAGALLTISSILNSALGTSTGVFGSVLILTVLSIILIYLVIVVFPHTADFTALPGRTHWYLYLCGGLGIVVVVAPIVLIPYIGAALTLAALVVGQLVSRLVADHFGIFEFPQITLNLSRIAGVLLLAAGVLLLQS